MQITVVGAGVFGLACALRLARWGAEVVLWEANPGGSSASAVAAGMLAPVGEVFYDPHAAPHAPLLRHARNLWPDFAASIPGLELDQTGAVIMGEGGKATAPTSFLAPDDWRVADVERALAALRADFLNAGGVIRLERFEPQARQADTKIILATGPGSPALIPLAPELIHLSPIKGQIARLCGGPAHGPALRWPGGYLVPHPSGALAGATMEAGLWDTDVDQVRVEALRNQAARYVAGIDSLAVRGRAGVRMETPDGLPMAGPSCRDGVFIASGARRNGWLLAPLISQIVAAYVTGDDPGPWADSLRPRRF